MPTPATPLLTPTTSQTSPAAMMGDVVWRNFLWRDHGGLGGENNTAVAVAGACVPIQAHIHEEVDRLGFQLLFSLLYFAVWLCAIVGNLLVLYVVSLKHVTLPSVRSVFICSLAVSDIVMSLTSLPITAVSIFTRDWVFPRCFCRLMGVFQGGSVFVSSFTLTAIAADRYLIVKHPTHEKITFHTALGMVAAIWLLGYALAAPVGLFSSTQEYPPFCGLFCDEVWPDVDEVTGVSRMRKLYGLLVLLFQFGLPTAISTVCYLGIGRVIGEQIRRRRQHEVLLVDAKSRLDVRKSRSSRMMATMVAGLVLAWLPMNLINLWRDFDDTAGRLAEWYSLAFAACHVVAMTSAVWNPIIYSWFNANFKETLRGALERRQRSRLAAKAATINNRPTTSNSGTIIGPVPPQADRFSECHRPRRPLARSDSVESDGKRSLLNGSFSMARAVVAARAAAERNKRRTRSVVMGDHEEKTMRRLPRSPLVRPPTAIGFP